MPTLSRRSLTLAACAAVLAALLAVAAFAPLPVSIVQPGLTADVLGRNAGVQVITISGTPVRATTGQLRLVTIAATGPKAPVHFVDVAKAWFDTGLAAMPRDVLEAARTDGANEWQTFRRVTVPLLMPVLSVVFVTMIINVLKVFDIVYALAPESEYAKANVIALAMYFTAFQGAGNFGVGSAIAVFLFLLVIPVLALNIRRFKREG